MIQDVTREFRAAETNWTAKPKKLEAQFPHAVRRIRDGLYASVFHNESALEVHDKNRARRVIIRPNSWAFKYGKFEKGLIARRRTDWRHLHRKPVGEPEQWPIFSQCLLHLWVLDLSGMGRAGGMSAARVFENYWNGSIEIYLKENGLLAAEQNGRSEWRNLMQQSSEWGPLIAQLESVAARVSEAAKVLGVA